MDASVTFPKAVSASMNNALGSFLKQASVEVTGKQAEKFPSLSDNLAKGSKVFVALIEAQDLALQITAVKDLRARGFEPVPHIPARFVVDEADLNERTKAFAEEAGVTTALILGGGAPQPVGKFDSALQLLQTGAFQKARICKLGLAGHPEGNPDITKVQGENVLIPILKTKADFLKAEGLEGFIATQFLFDAGPLALWASQLRDAGINLPIHVGVPGPATIKTLVKYAAMCGVGNSARFIRKQALNITKLLTVSEPTEFVDQLATLHYDKPELNIAAPHMYPFGGFDKLFTWMAARK